MERAGWLPEPARGASGLLTVLAHPRPHRGWAYVMSFRIVILKHRTLRTAFRESARSYRTAIEKFPSPDIGKLQYVISGKIADLQPLLRCWSTQYNDAALLPLGNRIWREENVQLRSEWRRAIGENTFVMFLWIISVSTAYMVRRSCSVRRAL